MDKSRIRVFKLNDSDWVAAESLGQAFDWYEELTGTEIQPEDEPREISLNELMYVDSDYKEQQTYAWVIENEHNEFPCIIATTEV